MQPVRNHTPGWWSMVGVPVCSLMVAALALFFGDNWYQKLQSRTRPAGEATRPTAPAENSNLASAYKTAESENPQDKLKRQLTGRWKIDGSNILATVSAIWTFDSSGYWRCDADAAAFLWKQEVSVSGRYEIISDHQVRITVTSKELAAAARIIDCYFPSANELFMTEFGDERRRRLVKIE